ncbi:hypothetical protein Ancab_018499 [Ancistrocladus abbreviatus]
MLFAGCKEIRFQSLLLVLLLISVLQPKSGAIRSFPPDAKMKATQSLSTEDLFEKLFGGKRNQHHFELNTTATTARGGGGGGTILEDSKRRVPSCPDPLHN